MQDLLQIANVSPYHNIDQELAFVGEAHPSATFPIGKINPKPTLAIFFSN